MPGATVTYDDPHDTEGVCKADGSFGVRIALTAAAWAKVVAGEASVAVYRRRDGGKAVGLPVASCEVNARPR